jgi:signal transduction histidine kinase/ActR/RegA family two-component response regulator
VTREVGSDPAFRPWGAEAAKRGYASVAAFPIVSEEGVTLGSLAIYSADVSAFDEAEMALLRELAGDLAYGITALRGRAERLAMTARLLQADRMVAVGTLAAGVAHEINNPLAYVVSAATFTRDELGRLERELPAGRLDELKRASRDAEDGLRRVTTIVRDLKTYSRADEERSGRVELHAVLESSVNMALNEIKHRARLAEDYGQIPPVIGNEARLGQVFLNLLVNAAQAIPEGRMDENEIRVSTRTDDRGRAVISIRDSGTGIEPEVLRHVFEPFFTTKPVGVGTGLGLFVCRNIIDALGGEIEIDSEPGAGTVVRVILPAAPAGEPRALPPPPVVAEVPPNGRRGRVLVVDDEPAIGYALRRLLQKEHDVVVLASAREARDRVAGGERFDAIACDLMMPVMTGIDLFDALTAIAPDQADRMILLTGGAFTTTAREFLQRWPHPCLEKPIEAERLRALVHALVGRAAHGPAGGAENTAPADRWRYAAPLES